MVQRLGLLLDLDRENEADSVFEEASELSIAHGLADSYIDIHMMYGDYAWGKDKKHKREAMKSYAIAFAKTIETDQKLEGFGELAGHVLSRIILNNNGMKAEDIESLCEDTQLWLLKQIDSKEAVRMILWPFRAAAVALPYAKRPEELDRVLEELFKEDILLI